MAQATLIDSRAAQLRWVAIVVLTSMAMLGVTSCGNTTESPAAVPGDVVAITLEEAAAIRDDGDPFLLLDVRDNLTFRQSHVVGAQNIDVNNATSWHDRTAALDPPRRTMIYCGVQADCDAAAEKLIELEFTALFVIGPYVPDSDREVWRDAGLPIDH